MATRRRERLPFSAVRSLGPSCRNEAEGSRRRRQRWVVKKFQVKLQALFAWMDVSMSESRNNDNVQRGGTICKRRPVAIGIGKEKKVSPTSPLINKKHVISTNLEAKSKWFNILNEKILFCLLCRSVSRKRSFNRE